MTRISPRVIPSLATCVAIGLAALFVFSPGAAHAQLEPKEGHAKLIPANDVQVQLFAAEPDLFAPTAIDIDEQGRVWLVEGVNYRSAGGPRIDTPPYFPTPLRKTGDRIMVLEDTDGDGRCDKSRVFYEGLDINSSQGFAVFGGKVWLSQSPSIRTIEIKPDGAAGKVETLLTGFGGIHGDHSVHSVYLGPDGKLYGCFGDTHTVLNLPDGKKIDNWGGSAKSGVVFRMHLDATGFEVLGQNFRNGYECATDSFGTTFHSDNDDDEGNNYCRFVYVMPGGNFGYQPAPPHGLDWNMERAGIVPILMRTGGGAPAGQCIYEGQLLPEKYRGMPLLCEAGTGELFCFRLTPDGAGFRVEGALVDDAGRQTIDTLRQIRKPDVLLKSADRWYRPSDVCVAPDGSVFVSDFYNHIAGGRKLDDKWRGRIYRIIPKDHDGSYKPPQIDVSTHDGLLAALASPNLAQRAAAILKIRELKENAVPALAARLHDEQPAMRARVLHQLAALGEEGRTHVVKALGDDDANVRVAAVRALAQNDGLTAAHIKSLLRDDSPHVRRELVLSLRNSKIPDDESHPLLLELALQFDGYDRFYLEAVLLGLTSKEKARAELLQQIENRTDRAAAGLRWALLPESAVTQLSKAVSDEKLPLADRAAAADWLALVEKPEAGEKLLTLIREDAPPELARPALRGLAKNIEHRWKALAQNRDLLASIEPWTKVEATREDALRLAKALGTRALTQWRLSPAIKADPAESFDKVFPPEEAAAPERGDDWAAAKVSAGGMVDLAAQRSPSSNVVGYAVTLIDAAQPLETRLLAGSDDGLKIWLNGKVVHANNITRGAGPRQDTATVKFQQGLNRLLVKVNQGSGGWGFIVEVEDPFGALTEITAAEVLQLADPKDRLDPLKLPPDADLLAQAGDAARGRGIFFRATTACTKCHQLGGAGAKTTALGPALDGIGKKMGRDALLESIARPDAKVAPQWVTQNVVTSDGQTHRGLVAEETAEKLVLIDAAGRRTSIAKGEIDARKPSELSVMPQALVGNLTQQELADLLQFLAEQ